MTTKEKNELPIIMSTREPNSDNCVQKKCFDCKRKVYPSMDAIKEVDAKFMKKPKFCCSPCGRNHYQKMKNKKMKVSDSAEEKLGVPKEVLEFIGEQYLKSKPDEVAA